MTSTHEVARADAELRESLAVMEELRSLLRETTETFGLNTAAIAGEMNVSDIPITRLTAGTTRGDVLEIRVEVGDWLLDARVEGRVTFLETSGSWSDVASGQKRTEMERALQAKSMIRLFEQLSSNNASVRYQVKNDPSLSGFHWIATLDRFEGLATSGWLEVGTELSKGAQTLLVDDLGDLLGHNQHFAVCGPEKLVAASAFRFVPPHITIQRKTSIPLWSPWLFANLSDDLLVRPPVINRVRGLFNGLAGMQVWASLATSIEVAAGTTTLTFAGPRRSVIRVGFGSRSTIGRELDLYDWVVEAEERDRIAFAQQALSLAIIDPSDLDSAAEPALGTAQSLYELSRHGSIAEALAARRAAREAAALASRSAATAARDAAAKSVERVTVQLVAAAGVVVAYWRAALTASEARLLLGLVVLICLATLAMTVFVTLRSASKGLDDELTDLDRSREALSKTEVVAMKSSGAVKAARSDIAAAKLAACVAYLGAAALALAAAILVGNLSLAGMFGDDPQPNQPAKPTAPVSEEPPTPDSRQ